MIYYILYNSLAGHGGFAHKLDQLKKDLGGECLDYDVTKLGSYDELIEKLNDDDVIVLCGGDGTLNNFVNSVDVTAINNDILYFASGSGNDFLNDIGKENLGKPFKINKYLVDLPTVTVKGKKYRVVNGVGYGLDGYCCHVGDVLNQLDHLSNTYENAIKSMENAGLKRTTTYYDKLKGVEESRIELLNKELAELTAEFQRAIASGEVIDGSEEWHKMNSAINDVKESIQKAEIAVQDFNNTIRDIDWEYFDYQQQLNSQITDESGFLLNLLNSKDMFDENGKITEYGNAAMGLHGVNYNVYLHQAKQYADEIVNIEKELASDPYNQDLIDRKEELLGLQRDSVLAAEEEKQAMIDLVTQGIEAELDALQDLIDKYAEALDSAKDLYDYQNKVSDATEEISKLQKMIIAYENDTSEEMKAEIQKLKVDLQEAQKELQETEYDQFISDQKKLLDNLYLEYETMLNRRLDNIGVLINSQITSINTNASAIKGTLETVTSEVGTTLSTEMDEIWTVTDEFKKVVTDSDSILNESVDGLESTLGNVDGSLTGISGTATTISGTLSRIETLVGNLKLNDGNNSTVITNPDNSGGVTNPDPPKVEPPKEEPKPATKGRWTSYQDAVDAGYSNILGASGSEKSRATQQYGSYQNYLDAMYYKYMGKNPDGVSTIPQKIQTNTTTTTPAKTIKAEKYAQTGLNIGSTTYTPSEYNSKIKKDSSGNTYLPYTAYGKKDEWVKLNEGYTYEMKDGNYKIDWHSFNTTYKLKEYKKGGLADFTGVAWLDGTKQKPEMVLNANDTKNFIELKDVLAHLAEDNISIGDALYSSVEPMTYGGRIPSFADALIRAVGGHGDVNIENHFSITIPIEKVEDYNDFVTKLQEDGKFEKMIQAMTIGRINGGNALDKYKYRWK